MPHTLRGYQNRYLRGLAHGLKPLVLIGQKGITDSVTDSISRALADHELIKIKFLDLDDRGQKKTMLGEIAERCHCAVAGVTGNTAILIRPHEDPEKRQIKLPERPEHQDGVQ